MNGTSNSTSGYAEILRNGTWAKVCDNSWGHNEMAVVCRQLGYPAPNWYPTPSLYPEVHYINDNRLANHSSSASVYLHNISCSGSEKSILDCSMRESYSCDSRQSFSPSENPDNSGNPVTSTFHPNPGSWTECLGE